LYIWFMKKVKKSTAGRKQLPEDIKKQEIKLFVEGHKVEELGGKEEVRKVSYKAIDEEIEKKRKNKKK
jgi:hypothetical protein